MGGDGGHHRILVVDDDPVCCRLIADMLENGGYQVEWTTVPAIAVERVVSQPYSLVVADVHMPHMLGTELAAEIGKRHPALPILLVSAFADQVTRDDAQALGAELLAKPIRCETLLGTVGRLLGGPGL